MCPTAYLDVSYCFCMMNPLKLNGFRQQDLLFLAVPSLTALSPGLSEAAAGGQVAAVAGEGTQPSSWDGGLAGAAGSSPPGLHTTEDSGLHSCTCKEVTGRCFCHILLVKA